MVRLAQRVSLVFQGLLAQPGLVDLMGLAGQQDPKDNLEHLVSLE